MKTKKTAPKGLLQRLLASVQYIKSRAGERSTYMFWIGSLGVVSSCPEPFNYIGGVLLFVAGLLPNKAKKSKEPEVCE